MKKFVQTFLIILFLLAMNLVNAQTPQFQWAKAVGGNQVENASNICIDRFGFIYIAGSFKSSPLNFDTLTISVSSGISNYYIAKYDSAGNVQWVRTVNDRIAGTPQITIDKFDHIYLAGTFTLDSINVGGYTLVNADSGTEDIFIIKYDLSGNVIWAGRTGGIAGDRFFGSATDAFGNFYITGEIDSCIAMKFDSSGSYLWSKKTGNSGLNPRSGTGISTDSIGNVYVTGRFQSDSISFDSVLLTGNVTLYSNMFLVKYNSSGTVEWAKATPMGPQAPLLFSIKVSPAGEIYLLASFSADSVIIGSFTFYNYPPQGDDDILLVKYDTNGNVMWAKAAGGNDEERPLNMFLDNFENVYIVGWFRSFMFNFGNTTFNLTGAQGNDFYVKYNSAGDYLWAKQLNGSNGWGSYAICSNSMGSVYTCGSFKPSIMLDTISLLSAGMNDIFIGKMSDPIVVNADIVSPIPEELIISPNPFNTFCTILCENLKEELSQELLTLYDLMGRILIIQNFNGKATLDFTPFAKGMYLVEINDQKGKKKVGKLVKQ